MRRSRRLSLQMRATNAEPTLPERNDLLRAAPRPPSPTRGDQRCARCALGGARLLAGSKGVRLGRGGARRVGMSLARGARAGRGAGWRRARVPAWARWDQPGGEWGHKNPADREKSDGITRDLVCFRGFQSDRRKNIFLRNFSGCFSPEVPGFFAYEIWQSPGFCPMPIF